MGGGNQSLNPQQLQQQDALNSQQLQYYQLANALSQQQFQQNQPQVGVPLNTFQSMGFNPSQVDPWSAYGGYG